MRALGPISFIFMQIVTKIQTNNRFLPQTEGLVPPRRLENPGSVTGPRVVNKHSCATTNVLVLTIIRILLFSLQTIAWVAIVGLFSFARVAIAVICREVQEDWLFYFALAAQLGCAVGSVCIADYFSICRVYRNFQQTTCGSL